MSPRLIIPIIIVLAVLAGFFVYPALSQKFGFTFPSRPFQLGLDLRGGTHLVYQADISGIPSEDRDEAMEGLRDVIERRVNFFGVSEPVIAVNKGNHRLFAELAGVTDVNEAIRIIGETPFLEFRELSTESVLNLEGDAPSLDASLVFVPTELDGRYLKRASVQVDPQTNAPLIFLEFNDEGARLFAEITKRNVGRPLAIYLDGEPLSSPIVQEEISGGQATITGSFTVPEARDLVRNLNAGALPVPISLISQQTVGATLGQDSLVKSLVAGLAGFAAVALFMIIRYRLAGIISVISLSMYALLMLVIFKGMPVTLTLSGIVGFILSIGMAVDANILIFERMREELRKGRAFPLAVREGFKHAWTAIRDANISTLMTAAVLYWFGTSLVRGFALTLGIGLVVSLAATLLVTLVLLKAFAGTRLSARPGLWHPRT
jgi:preprotein translocase subunit SecD